MPKIDITRTELVWPGKYNDDGTRREPPRVHLPFQIIERVDTARATREGEKAGRSNATLFDTYRGERGDTFETGWRNKLIWGDNLLVMGSLLEQFAGKIDLIYIDPPFATGADFTFDAPIGENDEALEKTASAVEEKAYRDTWGNGVDSYTGMLADRLLIMRDLLSPTGSILVHCDWHVNYIIRGILNEVFGSERFVNEVIWYYYNKFQGNVNKFAANHDVIYWYSKSSEFQFEPLKEKRENGPVQQIKRTWDKEKGSIVNVKGEDGKVVYQTTDVKTVDDVWRLSMLQPADRTQNVGYPTQKPETIVERFINALTPQDALIADFFCGSGTTLAVAEKLGRRWIGCDLGRFAVHTTRKRMLGIEGCKPFEILNLGKYERQYWQGTTFATDGSESRVTALFEYLAFVLKLYKAQPVAGMSHIHGRRSKALVHVGAVDAPVTIDEAQAAIAECVAVKQTELHILGWEWEMGLNDLLAAESRKQGVKLLLLQIPREVMERQTSDKGDVRFFELAYLAFDPEQDKKEKRTYRIRLKDFAIPNTDLIPEEVRSKIRKWSDYVDYWAVDWDFRNDTFLQGFVTYRTRKDRSLALISDAHTYEAPGTYRVLVKVVDIFGNDTTQAVELKVR